jgi:hypothetical protein
MHLFFGENVVEKRPFHQKYLDMPRPGDVHDREVPLIGLRVRAVILYQKSIILLMKNQRQRAGL